MKCLVSTNALDSSQYISYAGSKVVAGLAEYLGLQPD